MRSLPALLLLGFLTALWPPELLAQAPCPEPNNPLPEHPTQDTATCAVEDGPLGANQPVNILDPWPQSPGDFQSLNDDLMRTGIPFSVRGRDKDRYTLHCVNMGTTKLDTETNDTLEYCYTIEPGNLPEPGYFEGDQRHETIWPHPSAVYRLPPGLPDGVYTFSIICSVVDTGDELRYKKRDLNVPIAVVWELQVTVQNCKAKVTAMSPPEPIIEPGGPITGGGQSCCDPSLNWVKGDPISPLPGAMTPTLVEVGQWVVISSPHEDWDYLERHCDDKSGDECNPTGTRIEWIETYDACDYTWSVDPTTGSQFGGVSREYAVVWRATQPGTYEICVVVGNFLGQAMDEPKWSAPFPILIEAVDRILKIESRPALTATWVELDPCKPSAIDLWVNDDDDDADGIPDKDAQGAVNGENDLHGLRISDMSQLGGGIEVRLRVEGAAGSINLFRNADRSNPISMTNPPWITVPAGGLEVYVEGAEAHALPRQAKIFIDAKRPQDPPTAAHTKAVEVTVFGIAGVDFVSDPSNNGTAEVATWSTLPSFYEMPAGFEDPANPGHADPARVDHDYFFDPGADVLKDTPVPQDNKVWANSRRHLVKVRVTVTPSVAGVRPYVTSLDVDDNSYPLYGSDLEPERRNFLDPYDRLIGGAFHAQARKDNNDGVPIPPGGTDLYRDGAIEAPLGQNRARMLQVPEPGTNEQGVAVVWFVASRAPGDNFRVLASMAPDILEPGTDRVLAAIPGDYPDSWSHEAEREAAVVFKVAPPDQPQQVTIGGNPSLALRVPLHPQPGGVHTLASRLLTVRRRIWVETLRPSGLTPEVWNFDMDPALENSSGPITRYVTRIETVADPAHREFEIGPKTGPVDGEAGFLRQNIRLLAHNVWGPERPYVAPAFYDGLEDVSDHYGLPRHTVGGVAPWPHAGAFESGRLLIPDPLGAEELIRDVEIFGNGKRAIYVESEPEIPFQIFQNGVWQSHASWRFKQMRPVDASPEPKPTELILAGQNGQAIADGQPLRVARGSTTENIPGQSSVVGNVAVGATKVVVSAAANGDWFRFPCQVWDDDDWRFRARDQEPNALGISARKTMGDNREFLYANHMVRDACVAFVRLPWPYGSDNWPYQKHNPLREPGAFPWNSEYLLTEGGMLNQLNAQGVPSEHSLLYNYKFSQPECWVMVQLQIPDGEARADADPPGDDDDPYAERPKMLFGVTDRPRLFPVPLIANTFMPWLALYDNTHWEMAFWHSVNGDQHYQWHDFAGITNLNYERVKTFVHEALHNMLPTPMPADPDEDPDAETWAIYASVVTDLLDGHHQIPGVTAIQDLTDPVASPTQAIQATGWNPNLHPCILSPYAVRVIKQTLLTLSDAKRPRPTF